MNMECFGNSDNLCLSQIKKYEDVASDCVAAKEDEIKPEIDLALAAGPNGYIIRYPGK